MKGPLSNVLALSILIASCGTQVQEQSTDTNISAHPTQVVEEVNWSGGYVGEQAGDGTIRSKMHLSEDMTFYLVLRPESTDERLDIQGKWRATGSGVELIMEKETTALTATSDSTLQFMKGPLGIEYVMTKSN